MPEDREERREAAEGELEGKVSPALRMREEQREEARVQRIALQGVHVAVGRGTVGPEALDGKREFERKRTGAGETQPYAQRGQVMIDLCIGDRECA